MMGSEDLEILYQRFWVAQEDIFSLDPCGARYIDIGDSHDGSAGLILVRDEYIKIWDLMCKERILQRSGGLVVTGHPGIGKSLFLKYALLRALREHIPVVYCYNSQDIFTFQEEHYEKCSLRSDYLFNGVLCLVDTNDDLVVPPGSLTTRFDRFVLQVAPPNQKHWEYWMMRRFGTLYAMNLWTRDEMKALWTIRNKFFPMKSPTSSRYTPLELFDIIGPSPRDCILYANLIIKTPDGPETDTIRSSAIAVFENLSAALLEPISIDLPSPSGQEEDFYRFFFCAPCDSNPTYIDAIRFEYSIPTPFLRRCIADCYYEKEIEEKEILLCQSTTRLPQITCIFYESFAIDFLQAPHAPLPCYLSGDTNSPSFTLTTRLSLRPFPFNPASGPFDLLDDCIYVLPASFPSPDAFVVSENMTRITVLQVTVLKNHDLNIPSIRLVVDALKTVLPSIDSVHWSVLIVTPDECGINIVHRLQKKYKGIGTGYPPAKLGWLNLGPESQNLLKNFHAKLQNVHFSDRLSRTDVICDDYDGYMEE